MMQTVETVSTAEPKYQPATTAERWLGVAVVGLWILHLATILLRPPGSYMLWADSGVYDAIYLGATLLCVGRARRHPAQRGPWLALALSLAVTIAGDQYYNLVLAQNPDAPYPSLADVFWLTFFPAAYVGLALLIRTTVPRFMSSMWLDGLIAGLGGAALIYTFAFDELLALTEGSRAAVLVSLAYPVGDLLLLVMLLGGVVMLGSRAGRMWTLLALGLVAFSVSDVLYAYGLAAGAYVEGSPVDLGWTAAAALMGLASLSSPTVEDDSVPVWWAQLIVPGALSFGTIGLLVYGQRGTVPLVATVLALGALGAGGVRVLLTWREVANLSETRRQARTDELTGLLNRRGFRAELSAALEE